MANIGRQFTLQILLKDILAISFLNAIELIVCVWEVIANIGLQFTLKFLLIDMLALSFLKAIKLVVCTL